MKAAVWCRQKNRAKLYISSYSVRDDRLCWKHRDAASPFKMKSRCCQTLTLRSLLFEACQHQCRTHQCHSNLYIRWPGKDLYRVRVVACPILSEFDIPSTHTK